MTGYTYFESYYKAIRKLPDNLRLSLRDAIDDYMFADMEPVLEETAMCFFELMRPTLDISKKRAKAGAAKSNEIKTKTKQIKSKSNEIKTETNVNHSPPKDKDKDKEKDKGYIKDSCAERSCDHAAPPVVTMPLIDGTEHIVTQADVEEYKKLYPAVDVVQQLRNMRGWCNDNPKNRKTKSGIRRFIGAWLSREQNRSRARPPDKNAFNAGIRQDYDFNNLRQQFVVNA